MAEIDALLTSEKLIALFKVMMVRLEVPTLLRMSEPFEYNVDMYDIQLIEDATNNSLMLSLVPKGTAVSNQEALVELHDGYVIEETQEEDEDYVSETPSIDNATLQDPFVEGRAQTDEKAMSMGDFLQSTTAIREVDSGIVVLDRTEENDG